MKNLFIWIFGMIISFIIVLSPFSQARADSYWLRGGLIGAGVGVGAGSVLGFGLCGLSEENQRSCLPKGIAGGAVLVGSAGFGVGALIGWAFKKEDKVSRVQLSVLVDPQSKTYGLGASMNF
tara:strand:+ start:209 stop:574 length:366 start_codon:yes stop_codon:yes gene_type:complete